MEKSLYSDILKDNFPSLVVQIVEKLNEKNATELPYLYKSVLTPEFSIDGRWSSVLANFSQVTADVVSLDSSLPIKSRDAIEVVTGNIPKMGVKRALTEKQVKDINSLIAQGADINLVIDRIFADVPWVIRSIWETIEFMLHTELSTGYGLSPTGTGNAVRLDLKFKKENHFGVPKLWNDPDALALDNIQALVDKAEEDQNIITDVYADNTWIKNFCANKQVRAQYAFDMGVTVVGDNIPVLDFEKAADVIRRKWNIVLHRVNRKFKHEISGDKKNSQAWKAGVASFVCDSILGRLVWTDLVESSNPVPGVMYQPVDEFILVSQYAENDPWREFTTSQAMCVPVLNNTDRIYLLDTTEVQA